MKERGIKVTAVERRRIIRELTATGYYTSQKEILADLYSRHGIAIPQYTLSKDFAKIGVERIGDRWVHPDDAGQTPERTALRDQWERSQAEMFGATNLLLLRTLRGHERLVGHLVEQAFPDLVYGSIPGDGIVVICTPDEAILNQELGRLLLGAADRSVQVSEGTRERTGMTEA